MVTINIEDYAIKLLVVDGNKVRSAYTQPLEPGLVKDGVVIKTKAVAQKIKELFHSRGITNHSVTAAVSGIHSIYRTVKLPKIPPEIMEQAVRQEMSRAIPVPLDELYISWQVIPNKESPNENTVLLLGIPRETLDPLVETLRQANLSCRSIDLKPVAIARVSDVADSIVINVQQVSFDIVILIKGIPELIRSVPFLTTNSSADQCVKQAREELDRTISFYNANQPGNAIGEAMPLFVSGEFKDLLVENLPYPVKPLPKMLQLKESFNFEEYIVNIGLALKRKGTGMVRMNINAIPVVHRAKPLPLLKIAAYLLLIMTAGYVVMMAPRLQPIAAQNAQLQEQIPPLQDTFTAKTAAYNASLEAAKPIPVPADNITPILQEQLAMVQIQLDTAQGSIDAINAKRPITNADLGVISSRISSKITLATIDYNGSVWTVDGLAPDSVTIMTYVHDLETGNRFASVRVTTMSQVKFDQWTFTLAIMQAQ
jgi:type IV pilus assembly protein PilM